MLDDFHQRASLPRRRFLRGLAAGTVLWPFLPGLDRFALAAPPPRRFVAWYYFLGTWPKSFWPTDPANPTSSPVLAPLAPFAAQTMPVMGVKSTTCDGCGPPHFAGTMGAFTGSYFENMLVGLGPAAKDAGVAGRGSSLDHYLGDRVGSATPFSKLTLQAANRNGADNPPNEIPSLLNYQAIPAERSPRAAFDRLFANVGAATGGMDRLRSERKSVIDVVRADLAALGPKLGVKERYKVDQHLSALRAIESRMDGVKATGGVCQRPALDLTVPADKAAAQAVNAKAFMDIMAMAFACDLTRVVGFNMGLNELPWLGEGNFHGFTHGAPNDPVMIKQLVKISTWHHEQLAYFAGKLKAISEGGQTVLDNTTILTSTDVSEPNAHSKTDMPHVVLGGGGGFLRSGRLVQLPPNSPSNRLFVTMCHAMGFTDVQRYGDTHTLDKGTGPLAALS